MDLGLFDFNRDDRTDFSEGLFGLAAISALLAAAETGNAPAQDAQAQARLKEDVAVWIRRLENRRADFEAQLRVLRSKMPDNPVSEAYERWRERCGELEDQIDDIELDILKLKGSAQT